MVYKNWSSCFNFVEELLAHSLWDGDWAPGEGVWLAQGAQKIVCTCVSTWAEGVDPEQSPPGLM